MLYWVKIGSSDMDLFHLKINNQNYTYLDSICLDNKEYVAYMDSENVYVSECVHKGDIFFQDVSDAVYTKVIEALGL